METTIPTALSTTALIDPIRRTSLAALPRPQAVR